MNRLFIKILIIALSTGFFYSTGASACRYTVREIGFSDIGSEPYQINVFTKSDTPKIGWISPNEVYFPIRDLQINQKGSIRMFVVYVFGFTIQIHKPCILISSYSDQIR